MSGDGLKASRSSDALPPSKSTEVMKVCRVRKTPWLKMFHVIFWVVRSQHPGGWRWSQFIDILEQKKLASKFRTHEKNTRSSSASKRQGPLHLHIVQRETRPSKFWANQTSKTTKNGQKQQRRQLVLKLGYIPLELFRSTGNWWLFTTVIIIIIIIIS